MFVHDLNQFVTVHLLEETPVVLSLVKLCEDRGYSYEWVSGQKQKPRLTKNGNSIICKTGQFRTSCRSRVIRQFWDQFVLYIAITTLVQKRSRTSLWQSSAGSVFARSDEQGHQKTGLESRKNKNQNKKRDDKKNADGPLADIPEWFTEFKEHLVKELPAPAHSSRESIRLGTSCRSGNNIKEVQY